jgi:hypothetical protein
MFTESLGFWELLIAKNQDVQKLLVFQGAFEKLFNVIESEGGVESRVNAESALTCVDTLLRFNSANQVGCYQFILRFFWRWLMSHIELLPREHLPGRTPFPSPVPPGPTPTRAFTSTVRSSVLG